MIEGTHIQNMQQQKLRVSEEKSMEKGDDRLWK